MLDYAASTTASSIKTRTPARWRALTTRGAMWAALAAGCLMTATFRYYLPQQAYAHWLSYKNADIARKQGIGLRDFAVAIDAKAVEPGLKNLSAITYDYDQDRLLAVTNGAPMELLVLSKAGDIQGRYPLEGFGDPEGLAYLGEGRVVIADEKQQRLAIVGVPEQERPIDAGEAQYLSLQLGAAHSNKGFEGVTYDPGRDRLYVIKERDPRALYEVTGLLRAADAQRVQITLRDLAPWLSRSVFARDLSDGYYDPGTGHLLVLSDESRNITELDGNGGLVSIRSLRSAASDLASDAPQAEGITMDTAGNLYVVSEPNLFYAFKKTQ